MANKFSGSCDSFMEGNTDFMKLHRLVRGACAHDASLPSREAKPLKTETGVASICLVHLSVVPTKYRLRVTFEKEY